MMAEAWVLRALRTFVSDLHLLLTSYLKTALVMYFTILDI